MLFSFLSYRIVVQTAITTIDSDADSKLSIDEVIASFSQLKETINTAQKTFFELMTQQPPAAKLDL